MKKYLLIAFFVPYLAFSQEVPLLNTDSILTVLEGEIAIKESYIQKKLSTLDAYKSSLSKSSSLSDKYRACWHIVDQYKSFQYDSAFFYSLKLSDLAYQIGSFECIQTARIKTAFVLESGGLLKEAADTLEAVDLTNVPDSIRSEFYSVTTRLYDFMAYFVKDFYYAKIYQQRSRDYMTRELALHSQSSLRSHFIRIQISQAEGDFEETERVYLSMVKNFKLTHHQLAMRSYDMGVVFDEKFPEKAIYYKALSAINDIRGAVKENVSMRELAESLFRKGDLRRSSLFIKQALDDANFYSSRLRKVEVSDILPIIEGKQYQELESRNTRVINYSYIITLLVIALGLFLFIIFRQLRKLRISKRNLDTANESLFNTNHKLEESNKIKEAYIGQFFNLISEHLFKTEKLVTSINRKLSQRKFDDLSEITDNINSFKERELLYKNFDDMFLNLFPDFIEKLNGLLKKDEQLDSHMKLLTPEIRIYALLRLGINDNNQIARLLNYSINTIYTYKTRLKNKAVDPETFEESIIDI
ncbi:MAG: DUF6377 domain-containing protein [Imperialibacter sp.]|uniref:DUF6377 domain-containing protein n=1 Tax=Imperialibacter sp. TaxID=2038411 RepID=UPI0032EF4D60